MNTTEDSSLLHVIWVVYSAPSTGINLDIHNLHSTLKSQSMSSLRSGVYTLMMNTLGYHELQCTLARRIRTYLLIQELTDSVLQFWLSHRNIEIFCDLQEHTEIYRLLWQLGIRPSHFDETRKTYIISQNSKMQLLVVDNSICHLLLELFVRNLTRNFICAWLSAFCLLLSLSLGRLLGGKR